MADRVTLAEWGSLHTQLTWIYDGPVYPTPRNPTRFAFDHVTAWMVRAGSAEVSMAGKTWRAGPGEWLIPPRGEREQHFAPNTRLLSVRFRIVWPTGENLFDGRQGLTLRGPAHRALLAAATPLARFVKQSFPSTTIDLMQVNAPLGVHLRLQTLFTRWLETFVNVMTEAGLEPTRLGIIDHRLVAAVRQLDHRPLAEPLTEAELALSVNLSASQLNRLFIRQFGFTPRGYFERRRFQQAFAVIVHSNRSVKEIAYELGFSSLPHFSTWFKRHHGVPPTLCREQAARGEIV